MNEEIKILKKLSNLNVLKLKALKFLNESNHPFFAYPIVFIDDCKQRLKKKLNGSTRNK